MQELQEKMHRGMNLPIRDQSEYKREVQGQVDQEEQEEEVLNLEEEKFFKAISKIKKYLRLMFPHFWEILTQRS